VSIEASSFVLGLSMGRGNGIRKLILLGYANHADKLGRGAYPSTQTIADYAECDVRTVQRHVGWLLERGFLHEGDQRMVDHLDPRYRPIVYDVAMSVDQIQQRAADDVQPSETRTRAAEAGRRGGHASSQVGRGDNLSPLPDDGSQQVSSGDSLSPLETGRRGDNDGRSGVTSSAARGDIRVTRTVQKPSREPSSSSPATAGAGRAAPATRQGGGMNDQSWTDAIDLLPETVRHHFSVIPSAIANRIQVLDDLGWPRAGIRRRLTGVETADRPGAAALTRLDALATRNPPPPTPARPRWCGQCDQRTRLREDPFREGRPYRCPECHPQATARMARPRSATQHGHDTQADR
jgi:general stress protein YciG